MRKLVVIVSMTIFAFMTTSCHQKPVEPTSGPDGGILIRRFGRYVLEGVGRVDIYKSERYIVNVAIFSTSGKLLHRMEERPSHVMRWFAYYDREGNLWFYSSDIGSFVLMQYEPGRYRSLDVPSPLYPIEMMPALFWNGFPQSVKRLYEPFPPVVPKQE